MRRLTFVSTAIAVAGLLAACGGGSSDPTPPAQANEVPASASATSAGLVAYLGTMSAASDADTRDPVDLTGFDPVHPEDADPEAVK